MPEKGWAVSSEPPRTMCMAELPAATCGLRADSRGTVIRVGRAFGADRDVPLLVAWSEEGDALQRDTLTGHIRPPAHHPVGHG